MHWPSGYTLDTSLVFPAPCEPHFTEGWLGTPKACGEVGLYATRCTYTLIAGWEFVPDIIYESRTQECH